MAQKRKQSSRLLPHLAMNHLIATSDVFEDSDRAFDPVPIAKKPKHAFPSLPPDTLKEMHQTELEKLSHEDLVAYVISLQGTLRKTIATLGNEQEKTKSLLKDASKKSVLAPSTANNLPTVQSLTPAQLILRADKLADMCRRGIKKEMIWKVRRSSTLDFEYAMLFNHFGTHTDGEILHSLPAKPAGRNGVLAA